MDDASRVAEPEGGYQLEPLSNRVLAAAVAVHRQPGIRHLVNKYVR